MNLLEIPFYVVANICNGILEFVTMVFDAKSHFVKESAGNNPKFKCNYCGYTVSGATRCSIHLACVKPAMHASASVSHQCRGRSCLLMTVMGSCRTVEHA